MDTIEQGLKMERTKRDGLDFNKEWIETLNCTSI